MCVWQLSLWSCVLQLSLWICVFNNYYNEQVYLTTVLMIMCEFIVNILCCWCTFWEDGLYARCRPVGFCFFTLFIWFHCSSSREPQWTEDAMRVDWWSCECVPDFWIFHIGKYFNWCLNGTKIIKSWAGMSNVCTLFFCFSIAYIHSLQTEKSLQLTCTMH